MDTLLAAALLPAIGLMQYVYSKDKVEQEPVNLVIRVFLFGALSGLVAGFLEVFIFAGFEMVVPEGALLLVLDNFICVAAVEEACKYFCLNTVKKNPEFNYVFDAVVYSVAAALGFAAFENVLYVFSGGLVTAAVRAVLSVPGHMADGVVMGVFYGLARYHELSGKKGKARGYYFLAYLLPVLEHGVYDAALSTDSDMLVLFAIVLDFAFIAVAFILIRRFSAHDKPFPFSQIAAEPNGPIQGNAVQDNQPVQDFPPMQGNPQQPQSYPQNQGYPSVQGYQPVQGVPPMQGYPQPPQGYSKQPQGFQSFQGYPQAVPVQQGQMNPGLQSGLIEAREANERSS